MPLFSLQETRECESKQTLPPTTSSFDTSLRAALLSFIAGARGGVENSSRGTLPQTLHRTIRAPSEEKDDDNPKTLFPGPPASIDLSLLREGYQDHLAFPSSIPPPSYLLQYDGTVFARPTPTMSYAVSRSTTTEEREASGNSVAAQVTKPSAIMGLNQHDESSTTDTHEGILKPGLGKKWKIKEICNMVQSGKGRNSEWIMHLTWPRPENSIRADERILTMGLCPKPSQIMDDFVRDMFTSALNLLQTTYKKAGTHDRTLRSTRSRTLRDFALALTFTDPAKVHLCPWAVGQENMSADVCWTKRMEQMLSMFQRIYPFAVAKFPARPKIQGLQPTS
jgi:hypothetical protein